MRKGFTLIELLVVIAIIGLLASIVTVSLSSSQDRAKQAKIESFAAQVHHALAADAVGIWDFDDAAAGTANDTSGLKNNGVFPGGSSNPTSAADRNGQSGKAYQFTASGNQYISRADNPSLSMGDIDFTISAWVYMDSVPGASSIILGKFEAALGQREYLLAYVTSPSGFRFVVSNDGTASPYVDATNFGAPSTATWYHIIAWHDAAANTINIKVNNGTTNSTAHTTGVFNSTAAFQIGAYSNPVSNFWNGRIDDVRIYKRALSSAQIQQLYAEGLSDHSLAQE